MSVKTKNKKPETNTGNGDSYRESFGLALPGPGAKVMIGYMAGLNFYIQWVDHTDAENLLYTHETNISKLKGLIKKHKWNLVLKSIKGII